VTPTPVIPALGSGLRPAQGQAPAGTQDDRPDFEALRAKRNAAVAGLVGTIPVSCP
jgi:hypothetical protein